MKIFHNLSLYIRSLILKLCRILLLPCKSETLKNSSSIFNHLEEIAEIIPIPMYWIDRKGKILGANSEALMALGVSFRDVKGKKIHEFHPLEIADHIVPHNEQVMQLGKTLSQEEWIRDFKTNQSEIFFCGKNSFVR